LFTKIKRKKRFGEKNETKNLWSVFLLREFPNFRLLKVAQLARFNINLIPNLKYSQFSIYKKSFLAKNDKLKERKKVCGV